jgi:histidine triad (HIT) family protein
MANVSKPRVIAVRLDRCTVGAVSECQFCSAVAGAMPVAAVWSSDTTFAFLDHRPVFKGHVLVVPRAHIAVLADLPGSAVAPYFLDVQRIAVAVEEALGAGGSFVALNNKVSQSVPHLHTHVVPRTKGDGLRGFFWPRTKYDSPEEAASYAARIAANIAR